MLKYRVRLYWGVNDTLVCDAQTTAVMAHEICEGFMRDSFAGIEHKKWREDTLPLLLYPLLDNPDGRHRISGEWVEHYTVPRDVDCRARFHIEPIEVSGP